MTLITVRWWNYTGRVKQKYWGKKPVPMPLCLP